MVRIYQILNQRQNLALPSCNQNGRCAPHVSARNTFGDVLAYDLTLEETMKPFTFLTTLLLFTGLAVAEDKLPARLVRVVGTSEVKVVPDRVVIELGVEKQNPSARVAKQAADVAARTILASLRQSGVDEKDIQTTFLSLQPQTTYIKKVRVSYFVAAQTMTVTVRDLTKLEPLLESLVKAGGNRIDSIQYETSDLRKYRDQARDLAVKAAREKAHALGQEIGKAQTIEEVPEYEYSNRNSYVQNSYAVSRSPAQSGPSIAVGQKAISASVTVSFELN